MVVAEQRDLAPGQPHGVFVVAQGKAELRMVQLGTPQSATDVNSGLAPGT